MCETIRFSSSSSSSRHKQTVFEDEDEDKDKDKDDFGCTINAILPDVVRENGQLIPYPKP